MNYKLHKLGTGLKVLTVPMPSLESATIAVWVKTGSRNEEKRISGISHFLEHMVFKGSVKRPSAKQISEAVDAIGGEFNAGTSKDWTNFYIKSAATHVETAFDVLSDMVVNPILKPEEIEREKGTIIQEIAMYEDTPMLKIGDVFEGLVFDNSSLGWDTAGTPQSVKRIVKSDFVSYRKMHYYPENMIVSVVGGVSEKQALGLVNKYFGQLKSKGVSGSCQDYKSVQTKPLVKLQTKKTDQTHIILGFRGDGRTYENRFAQAVLATILGGGMSSRLFIEVRERRGLAYSVRTYFERYQEVGYLGTYAGVDSKKTDLAIKVILDEHYKLAEKVDKIEKKEIVKAKEYIKGHLALALEDTKDVSGFYVDQAMFLPNINNPEDIFKKIDKVEIEDVLAEAQRLFVPSRLNLAIIGNYNNQNRFEKLLK